jgi:hypothetical protein
MEDLFPILFLFFLLAFLTLAGVGFMVMIKWIIGLFKAPKTETNTLKLSQPAQTTRPCCNCGYSLIVQLKFCGICGAQRLNLKQEEQLRELEITLRQLERLHESGTLDVSNLRILKAKIESERERILFPQGKPGAVKQPSLFVPETSTPAPPPRPDSSRTAAPASIVTSVTVEATEVQSGPTAGAWSADSDHAPPPAVTKPPRKPFADVLAAFMEESNVRWGEIIGGLLIIGCSTALVISLWAQISRVPVMKFLIFTTVTAALFGIGFYTAHHWKLPTTSRGILTIATLLVPLNFLAIAAVSTNTTPGAAVIGSELLAPAIFLCLVYFAGRTITSRWPHVLAVGALGSSVGQLLVRHFGSPDVAPGVLVVLGLAPLIFYIGACAWMMKIAMADGEIDEIESVEIFTTLGALTFAAGLPFGLLLYKSGPIEMSMMHLAPLITLAAMPVLGSGMLLWRRVVDKELVATRTAGASIAILGMFLALAGMILAWPNPASIVPAALFNFLLFTAVAIALKEPRAHVVAAACLTFGYVIAFHVFAGHVPWQNLREVSLLTVTSQATTGQSLVIPFVAFILVSEWLRPRKERDARSYHIAAYAAAGVSLLFLLWFGAGIDGDPFYVSAIVALYAAGFFWIASRVRRAAETWVAIGLLFLASAQFCHSLFSIRFPWQASSLLLALACSLAALVVRRFSTADNERVFVRPLQTAAIVASIASASLVSVQLIWFGCEPALVFAARALLLSVVFGGLLVLVRRPVFFTSSQIALVVGAALLTKFALQHFGWYAFQPNAWLHPWALQAQGSVLATLCLAWLVVRVSTKKIRVAESGRENNHWFGRMLAEQGFGFDRALALVLVAAFVLVSILAAANGIAKELTSTTRNPLQIDFGGHPHALMFGVGSVILLALLVATMLGNVLERRREVFAIGALLTLWTGCALVAGRFESQFATASAARWAVALFLLIGSVVYAATRQIGREDGASSLTFDVKQFQLPRAVFLVITLLPLVLLTLSSVIDDVNYVPGPGPQSGIFAAMRAAILYGVPLTIAVLALAVHAVTERSVVFAFAAGLLVNFAATTVHIVTIAELHGAMNRVALVTGLQLNAIAAASVAMVWIATRNWWIKTEVPTGTEQALLQWQRVFPIVVNGLVIIPIAVHMIVSPMRVGRATFAAGGFNGWVALLLTMVAAFASARLFFRPLKVIGPALGLIAMASLLSFRIAHLGVANWAGFHVLLGLLVLIAWLMLLARALPRSPVAARISGALQLAFDDEWSWDSEACAASVGAIVVIMALRGPFSDPLGAGWSIGALLAMSALAASLNWVTFRRAYVYTAGIIFNVAVSLWLVKYHAADVSSLGAFIEVNTIALCLTGILWLYLELRKRRLDLNRSSSTAASFHHVAAILSLAAVASLAVGRLQQDWLGLYQTFFPLLDFVTLTSLIILMIACLWDREAKYSVAGLYVLGMLIALTAVHHAHMTPRYMLWWLTMAAAVQALVAASLWHARDEVIGFAQRLKIPTRIDVGSTELVWLLALNSTVIAVIISAALAIDLTFSEWPLRALAAVAVLGQCITFGLLAQGPRRAIWQQAAVAMLLIGVVFLSWSFLTPGINGTWLNRAVTLMAVMFTIVALFGLGLDKLIERKPDWTKSFRDCVPAMTLTGIAALAFVLGAEIYYQIQFGAVRIGLPALLTVAVTLAAAVIVCIFFALSPRHDPLNLPEKLRGGYVYAAEVIIVLLFMHIRLTMPWLFHGFFERYWPLVVLAIAYAGVAIAEFLKRRQVPVLATPIERTGAFLPLLPVIGFWIAQSQVEYSTLLFVVGGLYGLLSILRKSFLFGIAAALAGNGGLWYLLHETSEYRFYQHPQAWLIPAALSVLVAAQLNRKDFSESQMTGIRYLCLMTIYVSSTADIFINGVASSPWLPLVLAGLSLAGVLTGMMFRIRAFLVLGSTFLLLAIATMIKYASVNFGWTWLWYVAGIAAGAVIIATFAVFEKRRADVLRVVDGLKEWSA